MSLPSGYKRLEYIQSSGTQYIKTGIVPNRNTRIVLDVQLLSTQTARCFLFGSRESDVAHFWVEKSSSGQFITNYGTVGDKTFSRSLSPYSRYVIDKNSNITTIGSETITHTAGALNGSLEMFLFVENYNGTASTFSSMKLYSCKIYDGSTIVRNYIPCQNRSGTVGLWDDVNAKFHSNAGTGTFVAGPVISESVDENEITELEYIQSNGTQYVDTGFVPVGNPRIELDMNVLGNNDVDVFGTATSDAPCWILNFDTDNGGTLYYRYYSSTYKSYSFANDSFLNRRLKYSVGQELIVDGVLRLTMAAQDFSDFTQTVRIFGGRACAPLMLYACQIYDNGLLVRDYIPTKLSSGEVGLYDTVSHEFYRNEGTGTFIAGPEVVEAPKAPANFRILSESDTEVSLAWDADENAVGFRLYRDGALLADLTGTEYTDTATLFYSYTYQVRGYNEHGEGDPAELVVFFSPDNPILWLVTDRTQEDVSVRNEKGSYRATDLNRVGFAVRYLADVLRLHGITVSVYPKLSWTDGEWVTPAAVQTYLADVQALRGSLKLAKDTPEAPSDMEKLTYTEANQIEMILIALDTHIRNMLATVDAGWGSGLAYTGLYAKEAYL